MNTNQITVIVGSQWGDEGKGKITDYLAKNVDYVVRFQGGNNAGHTIIVGDAVYKFHLMPSGVISPNVVAVISNGVAIHPKTLLSELDQLKNAGIKPNLKISERAHLIMPYHIAVDVALNSSQGQLSAGSTKRGIMAVFADKSYRHGIRMGDIIEPSLFKEKLEKAYEFNSRLTKAYGVSIEQSLEDIYDEYVEYGKELAPYVCDTEVELYKAYKSGKRILFEGAQGMSLDPDHGVYPHTTSSNNVAGHVEVGSGVGFNCAKTIVGVVKAYMSRVGEGPLVTELKNNIGDALREKGGEYGTTTGRPRRIGWLDLVQVRQSVRTSGLTMIALTKLDVLCGQPEVKVCTAYDIDGQTVTELPASLTKIREAKPIYKTFAGWKDVKSTEVENYIKFIEKEVSCPIGIISFGPERTQTTIRDI